MMDLISRKAIAEEMEELIEIIKTYPATSYNKGFLNALKRVSVMIVDQPTIDAVPVVRCKDCKRWGMGIAGETDRIKCCMYARYMVGENGYCVYGEKGGAE